MGTPSNGQWAKPGDMIVTAVVRGDKHKRDPHMRFLWTESFTTVYDAKQAMLDKGKEIETDYDDVHGEYAMRVVQG